MDQQQRRDRALFRDPRILKATAVGKPGSLERLHPTAIRVLTSEYFDVVLNIGNERRKICKIQFRTQNGRLALYVHMAPFGHSFGRLSRVTWEGPPWGPETIDFADGGVTTTQMVKYNHPADGNSHFSQDNKVYSYFSQATPLREVHGSVFSLHFWGADAFALAGKKESQAPSLKRATVNLYADPNLAPADVAGRVVGWCYPRALAAVLASDGKITRGPNPQEPAVWTVETGEQRQTVLIAPTSPPPRDDLIFFLTYHPMERGASLDYPVMVFLGGFHSEKNEKQVVARGSYLALKYSEKDEDFEEMVRKCGSIDFAPTQTPPTENPNNPNLHTYEIENERPPS